MILLQRSQKGVWEKGSSASCQNHEYTWPKIIGEALGRLPRGDGLTVACRPGQ
jgi:hypothetical protein